MSKTIIVEKGNEESFNMFVEYLREKFKENDLVISSAIRSGTASAPNKKNKYYKTFPFALAPDLFTEKGHNDFFSPEKYKSMGIFFFPDGMLLHEEES